MTTERWIIVVNMQYYPDVEEFDSELAAKKAYDDAVAMFGVDAMVYLARVVHSSPGQRGAV